MSRELGQGYKLAANDGLGSISDATPAQHEAAVRQVCRRYRGEEAWEVLGLLGLAEVASRMQSEGSGDEAA